MACEINYVINVNHVKIYQNQQGILQDVIASENKSVNSQKTTQRYKIMRELSQETTKSMQISLSVQSM